MKKKAGTTAESRAEALSDFLGDSEARAEGSGKRAPNRKRPSPTEHPVRFAGDDAALKVDHKKAKGGMLTLRIQPELLALIQAAAEEDERTVADWVRTRLARAARRELKSD